MTNQSAPHGDLHALHTLKYRYAEAVDRCVDDPSDATVAVVVELFTADATADYGQFGSYQGPEALATFFRDVLPSIASWTRHFMLNPIVELDGARATGRWSALVHAVFKASADAGPQRLYVRYQDSYKKTDDGWRLQAVIALFDTPG